MAQTPIQRGKNPSAGENFAHPLYQLIGAPLLALVQAESQAAQATAEFIQNIGFTAAPDTSQPQDTTVTPSRPGEFESLGNLRMAKFSNEMQGPDGKLRTVNVQVPLLSLVPIPALQIKDAELEFYVRIVDFSKGKVGTNLGSQTDADTNTKTGNTMSAEERDFLSHSRMQFRAAMGRDPTSAQHPSAMDAQIKIKITMAQADIPVGLAKLFNIMDQSVALTQARPEQE